MNENSKVVKLSNHMNNKYVETLEVVDIDEIISDLFIPDYMLEGITDDGYLEYYENGDCEVVIVEYDDKVLAALNTFPSDRGRFVHVDKDGGVFVISMLPVVDFHGNCYYAGDEDIMIGRVDSFDNYPQWLANSLFEVKGYRTFDVTKETLIKIIEQKEE